MKRVLPAPMGRAYRIVKRSNHVTVVVSQKEKKVKRQAAAKTKEPAQEAKQSKEQKNKQKEQ